MRLGLPDIKKRVDWALDRLKETQGQLTPPIDLQVLCRTLGISVESRMMVPEGVFCVEGDGLKIYLQDNFANDVALRKRRRFTFAHEVCHALFYENSGAGPQLLPGSPKGGQLERLCQQGAGYLLMPSGLLERYHSRLQPIANYTDVLSLSRQFDVSPDVVLQRLHDGNLMEDDYAVLLVRDPAGSSRIAASAYGVWFERHFVVPKLGQNFAEWAEPFVSTAQQIGPECWEKSVAAGALNLTLAGHSGHSAFAEIRLRGNGFLRD